MSNKKQLVKYKKNLIKNLFNSILGKIKDRLNNTKIWNEDIERKIELEFTNSTEQEEVKAFLKELLTRNNKLLETIDIRILNKDIVNLLGKARLERIITDTMVQKDILELSEEQLQTYNYILNYKVTDFNERIGNLNVYTLKKINLEELKKLSEKDRLKVISIILSNSEFHLNDLSKLGNYYEERRKICQKIIDNPKEVEIEYEKEMNSKNEITEIPFDLLYEMKKLSDLERIKYAICETLYGMSLEKAKILCNSFGENITDIEQSEDTRIIKELLTIVEEDDIEKLRKIELDENYKNYEGTINIISNLRNAYLHKYQDNLYKINEEDYIDTQTVKIKRKKVDVKIYNVLGKNNDKENFNMILTSIRRNL